MGKEFFELLKEDFTDLYELGLNINKNIYENPQMSVINSRLFAEKVIAIVAEKENQSFVNMLQSQHEKIKYLNNDGIINDELVREFDFIRRIGNKAVHEGICNDIEYSVKVHKKLYVIVKWLLESYGSNYTLTVPQYKPVEFQGNKEVASSLYIEEIVKQKLEEYITKSNKLTLLEERGIERSENITTEEMKIEKAAMEVLGYEYEDEILEEDEENITDEIVVMSIIKDEVKLKNYSHNYRKMHNSYLLNELSKLSDSSKEAVESFKHLDGYKKYLHVDRSIQEEIIKLVSESSKSNYSQLLILAGSVGDGKSHLLAYLNEEYPEIMKEFDIHNDATESFDPKLTEIETLESVLAPFKDENIGNLNRKLILGINLGVLNNFLEVGNVKQDYTKLIKFINESEIFNQQKISTSYSDNNFKLVSFGDYNIYELTENGPESFCIEELINKITSKDDNNPFYNAYIKDIEGSYYSPIILNYKLLSQLGVKKRISNLIISAMVKYKKIWSTREILNFLYEILVPANIFEYNLGSTSEDFIDALIPNVLFNSTDKGSILKEINKQDPLRDRHEDLDALIIKLNITSNIRELLNEVSEDLDSELVDVIIDNIENFYDVPNHIREIKINTLIRLLYLVGNKKINKVFQDDTYLNFMKFLYYYNSGRPKDYKKIFDEVQKAVFRWNGETYDNLISLNEKLKSYKVSEYLELKPSKKNGVCDEVNKEKFNSFKTIITLCFEVKGTSNFESVDIDYQLYKKIININEGYYANKNEREEAVKFEEFIEKLLLKGSLESEVIIEDKRNKGQFKLKYENDFDEEFIFERVE